MSKNLINTINYCRVINGSKSFNNIKTQLINEMVTDYDIGRKDVIYRFDVLINSIDAKDVYVNDSSTSIKGVIDVKKKQTADVAIEESIQVYPNQIKQGDYVKFKINETDTLRTYLITSGIEKKHGYDEGIFKECNHLLKWMYKGNLYSTQSIVTNATKYTEGVSQSGNLITEIDARYSITIPYDEKTKNIELGCRFIINNLAWEVTQIDFTTSQGILNLTLAKNSVNSNDNLELEIADYNLHNYVITLNSTSETLQENGTYQIITNVTDKGTMVSNPSVYYTSSDETIARVDNNGLITALSVGNCTITCSIGEVFATLNLTIIAKSITPTVSYNYSFSKGSIIKKFVTNILTCTKTENGTNSLLNISCDWDSNGQSLISDGKITVTNKSTSSIAIKNVSVNTSTVIYLTVTDSDTNSVIANNIPITLTGM